MPHVRQQIREAVAVALTGLTTTGARVHQSRMRKTRIVPCLLIETNAEEVAPVGEMGGLQLRQLEVVVHGMAKDAAGIDDVLDTIAAEVEVALQSAGVLGGLLKADLELKGSSVEFDELEVPVGVVTLRYLAIYITQAGSPGVSL